MQEISPYNSDIGMDPAAKKQYVPLRIADIQTTPF
jgi:hypothetical protein